MLINVPGLQFGEMLVSKDGTHGRKLLEAGELHVRVRPSVRPPALRGAQPLHWEGSLPGGSGDQVSSECHRYFHENR